MCYFKIAKGQNPEGNTTERSRTVSGKKKKHRSGKAVLLFILDVFKGIVTAILASIILDKLGL